MVKYMIPKNMAREKKFKDRMKVIEKIPDEIRRHTKIQSDILLESHDTVSAVLSIVEFAKNYTKQYLINKFQTIKIFNQATSEEKRKIDLLLKTLEEEYD